MSPSGPYRLHTYPTVRRCTERVAAGETITGVARDEQVPYATLHGWCRRAGVHRPRVMRDIPQPLPSPAPRTE